MVRASFLRSVRRIFPRFLTGEVLGERLRTFAIVGPVFPQVRPYANGLRTFKRTVCERLEVGVSSITTTPHPFWGWATLPGEDVPSLWGKGLPQLSVPLYYPAGHSISGTGFSTVGIRFIVNNDRRAVGVKQRRFGISP